MIVDPQQLDRLPASDRRPRGGAERTHPERREFRDSAGRAWSVRERPIPATDWTSADEQSDRAGYGVGWLYFESGADVRHLRLYPAHWRELSDEELAWLHCRGRRGST